jgi:hypothetical protein
MSSAEDSETSGVVILCFIITIKELRIVKKS